MQAIISKAYAVRSNFEGANLRNAVRICGRCGQRAHAAVGIVSMIEQLWPIFSMPVRFALLRLWT